MAKLNIVAVTGGRDYDDSAHIHHTLDKMHLKRPITHLLEGGANGADGYARAWAIAHGVQSVICPASWGKYHKAAGAIRNRLMLQLGPRILVAFPGGKGTADCVKAANKMGIRVKEVKPAKRKPNV